MLALLAGIAGTTWGLIREARANARLAESLVRERKANVDLSAANAKVQARYDLAVEAIKTFHTGVSEDFLLKEEKFKDLRNRLLKSASDFYGKLGALLGKETDFASRRALAQSNFELADLTKKVGRPEAALAAHRAVLAMREELAADQGADAGVKTDVGRSLAEVAFLLDWTGKREEGMAVYRRSEARLAGLAGSDPAARGALAACRTGMSRRLVSAGRVTDALAACRLARADQELLAVVPGAKNDARLELADTISYIGHLLWYTYRPVEAARPSSARRWPSIGSSPTKTPASSRSGTAWRSATFTSVRRCHVQASRERRRPSFALRSRSTRSWRTTIRPSPTSVSIRRSAKCCSATSFATRASRRCLSTAPRWRFCTSWQSKIPASLRSPVGWQCAA